MKEKNPEYFLKIRAVVNELDPIGLIASGAPEDEHDTLTANILELIVHKKFDEIRDLIIESYSWYGFNHDDIKDEYMESSNTKLSLIIEKILEINKEYYGV